MGLGFWDGLSCKGFSFKVLRLGFLVVVLLFGFCGYCFGVGVLALIFWGTGFWIRVCGWGCGVKIFELRFFVRVVGLRFWG